MPRLPDARAGKPLKIKQQTMEFSFWPVRKNTRRYGLQSRVFVTNPWGVIRQAIEQACPSASRPSALAFLEQAQDYLNAASLSGIVAAKPVLLYYSMLNIVKSFVLVRGTRHSYGARVYHGLNENVQTGQQSLIDSCLHATPSGGSKVNVFDDFLRALDRGGSLSGQFDYEVRYLMPQIVQGHRLWCSASEKDERFIPIHNIEFRHDSATKSLWFDLFIYEDELNTKGIAHKRFLEEAGLDFQEVKCDMSLSGRKLIRFEQQDVTTYGDRPSDSVNKLLSTLCPSLWPTVLSVPPYRRYYAYLSPSNEQGHRLPQLASMFALFFYFGSVTRYRPHEFSNLLSKTYGAFISEVVETVPNQFLYLLASEFLRQEVTKSATL